MLEFYCYAQHNREGALADFLAWLNASSVMLKRTPFNVVNLVRQMDEPVKKREIIQGFYLDVRDDHYRQALAGTEISVLFIETGVDPEAEQFALSRLRREPKLVIRR